jgi:hypothetical protein
LQINFESEKSKSAQTNPLHPMTSLQRRLPTTHLSDKRRGCNRKRRIASNEKPCSRDNIFKVASTFGEEGLFWAINSITHSIVKVALTFDDNLLVYASTELVWAINYLLLFESFMLACTNNILGAWDKTNFISKEYGNEYHTTEFDWTYHNMPEIYHNVFHNINIGICFKRHLFLKFIK